MADRDAKFFQNLDDANMGGTLGPATCENEPDLWAPIGWKSLCPAID